MSLDQIEGKRYNDIQEKLARAAEPAKVVEDVPVVEECNKCGSKDLQERKDEIITFRDGKPYAVVRALSGKRFHICNSCRNVMVRKDNIDFRLLNRLERRRLIANNKKKGGKK